ncbi:hypothetical protein [Streptomyces sp. NPDC012616]|uniref:hypothetical protein n=1 Tax=Streptomyces sp. NPDC012616 TaxID=3364840 RepID=UPI0036EAE2B1
MADWASRAPDCTHQLDLCPDCDGLRVVRLERLPGIVDIRIDGDSAITHRGPAVVRIGRAPGPCPNPRREEA